MARLATIEAVEARLKAAWAATLWAATPVVGVLNPEARPADGGAHLLVQYPITNAEQISLGAPGANVWRDVGVFSVLVHQPKAKFRLAIEQADAVAAIFRGQWFDGVQCWAPSGAEIDDRNDKALFFVMSVAVPYQADLVG